MSVHYKWNIEKIIILPFGGLTIFNELINKPVLEEFMIAISGVIFQCIFYLILLIFNLNSKDYTIINNIILFINLIPVITLDGSKIIRLITDYLFSLKTSYNINLVISFLFLLILFIYSIFNLYIFLMSIFLLKENIKQLKNKNMYFNKFILERVLYDFNFKKIKYIKNIKKMKRDYYHIINGTKEKEFLMHKFVSK